MEKWDPNSCVFCGGEHRPGLPNTVPMCKIGRGAAASAARKVAPAAPSQPPFEPREPEFIDNVVPDWAIDAGVRRPRELDEPVIVKRDRLGSRIAMREYRLRKKLRQRGASDEEIAGYIAEAKAAWARGEKYRI